MDEKKDELKVPSSYQLNTANARVRFLIKLVKNIFGLEKRIEQLETNIAEVNDLMVEVVAATDPVQPADDIEDAEEVNAVVKEPDPE